ncbi:MAG: hypothetical protein ACE5JS_13280 [Nitrospinota bacterium]
MNTEAEGGVTKEDGKRRCGRGKCGRWGKLIFLLILAGGIAGWVNFFL